jgi:5-methyltetrahydropteroyltriglutamate--homocysteine methyltransferase
MSTRFRADHVGSFLRPQEVLDAHIAHQKGELPLEHLRALEDKAILDVLELQKQVGVDVFSDGELRRGGWSADFQESVEGYVPGSPPISLRWSAQPDQAAPAGVAGAGGAGGRVIGGKLKAKASITGYETDFLRQHAPGPIKVTMPAVSYVVSRAYKPGVTDKVYGSRAEVLADAAAIIKAEIEKLIAEGVTYIQLDNPHYPDYIDANRREQYATIGIDPAKAILEDIEADNASIAGIKRDGITIGMHLCRGNGGRGGWHTSGGYDSIAEQVFGRVNVDSWLLEYDSERAGGFEPLRFVPRGKTVVLGLITTKAGDLEPEDLIRSRIDEAAKYVALDDLSLSPQCGFASVMAGNPLSFDEQRKKLELVVKVARKVWT